MKCRLCLNEKELRKSHIIPAFVIRWLKDTSATGFLRSVTSPDVRLQDGLTSKLLCAECELLFSQWEKPFSEKLFTPYVTKELDIDGIAQGIHTSFEYSAWLLKFIISVQWRLLIYQTEATTLDINPKLKTIAFDHIDLWRKFLLSEKSSTGRNETHLVFLQSFVSGNGTLPKELNHNINFYLLRSIDGTMVYSEKNLGVYSKFGPVVAFTMLEPSSIPTSRMKNTKIHMKGTVSSIQEIADPFITEFMFITRPNEIFESTILSQRQTDKISETILKNIPRTLASQSIRIKNQERLMKYFKRN